MVYFCTAVCGGGNEHGRDEGQCEPAAPRAGWQPGVRARRKRGADAGPRGGPAARRRRRGDGDRGRDRRADPLRRCGLRTDGRSERAHPLSRTRTRATGSGARAARCGSTPAPRAGVSRFRWRRCGARRRAAWTASGRRATRRGLRPAGSSRRNSGLRASSATQRRPGALLPEHAPKPRGGTVYRDGLPEVQTTESNIRPSALAWSVTSPAARTWPGPPRGGCACALDRLRNRPYGVALGQLTGGSVRGFESGRRHGTNALAIARGARRRAGPGALCRVGAPPGRCCLKMWIASRCVLAPRAGKGTCGRGL